METLKIFWKNKYYRPLRLALFYSLAFIIFLYGVAEAWNDSDKTSLFFRMVSCFIWFCFAASYWWDWLQQQKTTKEEA
jgi:hypothetical protein